MSTINISLPQKQANLIDSLVLKYGFANRSEFIRSVIRLVIYEPKLLINAATYPFIPPKTRKTSEILNAFSKTKKYSKSFLKDLEGGLKQSDYFIS